MRVAVFQARSIPGRSLILGTQPLPLLPCEAGARTGAPSHEVPGDRRLCAAARGPSMPVRSVTGAAAQARQRSPDGKGPKSRSLWRDVSHQNGTTRDGIRLAKARKLDPVAAEANLCAHGLRKKKSPEVIRGLQTCLHGLEDSVAPSRAVAYGRLVSAPISWCWRR